MIKITENWAIKEFGDIVSIKCSKFDPKSQNERRKCIELEHIEQQSGRIVGYTNTFESTSTKNVFSKGDVLFGKLRPYLRKFAQAPFDGVCSSEIWVFTPQKSIRNDFLYYLIQSDSFLDQANKSCGTKMPRADWKVVSKYNFLLPPLVEQQKIAEVLSTVDKKIDLIDQKIAETEKLKTGLMQKLFSEGVGVQDENGEWHAHTEFHSIKNVTLPVGWKLDNLGTLLEKIVGGGTPSKAKPEYWGGSIPWASVKDFKKPWLSSDCIMDTITNEGLKNSSANLIEPDVVVIPTRMALGKVAITKGSIAINQDLKALYPKNIIDNLFLFYWLQHQASKIENLGSGSTVAGIRLEILKSIDCLYPESISEQKQISRILKCTDSKIDLLIEQKVATQKLKKGLMQKLLTGEWRVPVEETEAA